jgi:hypothetical protein
MDNQTINNQTIQNQTIQNQTGASGALASDAWVESGAMVYVALTVATLSAVIMCCVWFVKQRFRSGRLNNYGSLSSSGEEHVELKTASESSDSEEEISLEEPFTENSKDITSEEMSIEPPRDAFTLDDSDSEEGEHDNAV